jgi:hypothetical protein
MSYNCSIKNLENIWGYISGYILYPGTLGTLKLSLPAVKQGVNLFFSDPGFGSVFRYVHVLLGVVIHTNRTYMKNPYAAFLRVVRVFNLLTLRKRTGQLHAIDAMLSHCPKGNLLVWCPACPEPGFNSDPCCPKTPHHLRYTIRTEGFTKLMSGQDTSIRARGHWMETFNAINSTRIRIQMIFPSAPVVDTSYSTLSTRTISKKFRFQKRFAIWLISARIQHIESDVHP